MGIELRCTAANACYTVDGESFSLYRDGQCLGHVTLCFKGRVFCLGLGNPRHPRPGTTPDDVQAYVGEGWRKRMRHDAALFLIHACRVDVTDVDLSRIGAIS